MYFVLYSTFSLFRLVRPILAAPTMSPSFRIYVCVVCECGCVALPSGVFWMMDDGCCEIQWKPK